jgi:hypothetical protein
MGSVFNDGTRDGRRETTSVGIPPFIRNSITLTSASGPVVSESPADFLTLYGTETGETRAIPSFPARSGSFGRYSPACYGQQAGFRSLVRPPGDEVKQNFWAGDGEAEASGVLKVIYRRIATVPRRTLDVEWRANAVATFAPTADGVLALASVVPAPTSEVARIAWGAATLRRGRWLYVYGIKYAVRDQLSSLHVARVPSGRLEQAGEWRFWTGRRFVRDQRRARALARGVDTEFSVVRTNGRHVLVSVDAREGVFRLRDIRQWTSRSPTGPFRRGRILHRAPEFRPNAVVAYNAHVHPQHSSRGRWLVGYSVLGPDHVRNVDNYRPRFVWIRGLGRRRP